MRGVLLFATEIYGTPGGVQTYMRRLVESISAYAQQRRSVFSCISLNDVKWNRERHGECDSFVGAAGRKVMFVNACVREAWRCRGRVVVAGHVGLFPVAWLLVKMRLVRSWIAVLHGVEAWRKQPFLILKAARSAALIVATTDFTAARFATANGIPLGRMRVIPLALGEEPQVPLLTLDRRNRMEVISVGRLSSTERYKGTDHLIRAVGRLRAEGLNVRLSVIGDGDDRPRLEAMARDESAGECVHFAGFLGDSELQDTYRACDVFAMPSRDEGFGLVFLEAMSYGKPCVGAARGGTPEVISHGKDGYLVEFGDVDGLTATLRALYQSPELRTELGKNGYRKVQSRYLFGHMRQNWFNLLDEASAAPRD